VVESSRVGIVAVDDAGFWEDRAAIRACLLESLPRVLPWFGYDDLGSELFEEITRLPTYYLTRVERALLEVYAGRIADRVDGRVAELGSGSAKKTRLLLDACLQRRPTTYLPIDVSRGMLAASSRALAVELPELGVQGLWGRYEAGLAYLRDHHEAPVTVAFLGSNLGNTTPASERRFSPRSPRRCGRATASSSRSICRSLQRFSTPVTTTRPTGRRSRGFGSITSLTSIGASTATSCCTASTRGRTTTRRRATSRDTCTRSRTRRSLRGLELVLDVRRGASINVGFSAKFDRHAFVTTVNALGFTLDSEWIDTAWQYGLFLFARL
jgi:L-histidine N-alpha-methyltransferase